MDRWPIPRRWLGIVLIVAGGAGLLIAATSRLGRFAWITTGRDTSGPYHVLLIVLDTTRKDHLSCYGYSRRTTPHIDELARDSMRFTRAVAVSNWTLPTHASMFCGLYPTSHGAHWVTEDTPHIDPSSPAGLMKQSCLTLAEVLKGAGYRTGAVVGNIGYLSHDFQLDQGFDLYDDEPRRKPDRYRPAEEVSGAALQWLEQGGGQPFFLFVNFMDPHPPYRPPAPYAAQFRDKEFPHSAQVMNMPIWHEIQAGVLNAKGAMPQAMKAVLRDLYDGEIAYMDFHVGRLISWLREHGLYDRTLIILTADHGESFGEHGLMGHGIGMYEPEVAVPMIVKLPFSERTGIFHHGVQHVDVMPTVLERLGLPVPDEVQGRSMLAAEPREIFAEEYIRMNYARIWPRFNREQRAFYQGPLKYIEYSDGEYELYDLNRDPDEAHNLAEKRAEDVLVLRSHMQLFQSQIHPVESGAFDVAPAATEETVQRLRELGYIQ